MRTLLILLASLCLPLAALAQNPLQLGTGDAKGKPQVRIADDPLQQVKSSQQTLLRRQQELPWKEAEGWANEQAQVRTRRLELEDQRERYLLDNPPAEAERRWSPEEDERPAAPAPEAPDAGAPPDGGLDGGVDGAPAPDLAPPDAAVRPPDLLAIVPLGDKFLPPQIHPEEVTTLTAAIAELRGLERTLSSLQRLHNEQAAQITAALAQADALLSAAEAREEGEKSRTYSIREVEKIALQVHLARIEEALARARQRSTPEAIDDTPPRPDDAAAPEEVSALSPAKAYEASLERAEALRESARQASQRIARLVPRIRLMRRAADDTRELRDSLDLEFAQRELAARERTLEAAQARLEITREDAEWAAKRLENSRKLRAEGIAQIEEELDTLRTAAAHAANDGAAADEDIYSDIRVRAKRIMFLKEKLAFERLKLQRDQLWYDLTRQLPVIIAGRYPEQAFLESYRDVFDARAMKERQVDLETRCDGWRRARNTAKQQEPAPGKEFNKELLLEVYAGLTDLCMREDWVLGTESRLGAIAGYHLQRLEWSSRGVWWYAWRTLVSLLILALVTVGSRTLRKLTRRLAGNEQPNAALDTALVRTPAQELKARLTRLRGTAALVFYLGATAALWLWVVILSGRYVWGLDLVWSDLLGWATHPIFLVGSNEVSIWSLVQVILWFTAGLWMSRVIQNFVTHSLLDHFAVERGIRDAVGTVIRYLVVAVSLAVGLASVGIGLGALGLLFGVIGIGIGFGLQNIASNFISGFILLFERPIRRGDFVQVGELVGEVKDISARATTLETRDGITVIVPNSEFVTDRIVNWTLGRNERVRAQVQVGVAYGTDIALVERLLIDIARADKNVLVRPAPVVHMTRFGDSSLDFVLHIWTRKIRGLPGILSELNKAVDRAFAEHGVQIPFPQRTVHHVHTARGAPAAALGRRPEPPPALVDAVAHDDPDDPDDDD